jgi:alpha-mannosidase
VDDGRTIENERFAVEVAADGTLRLEDRALGARFDGLLRLRDVGDRGDSYNFCAVDGDTAIERAEVRSVRRVHDACGTSLEAETALRVPARLAPDRRARSADLVDLPVRVRVSLAPGLPRVDVEIEVENRADDHRLSLLFPVGAPATSALYDGHFEIVRRPTAIPAGAPDWSEQPVAEQPMRYFVAAQPDDARAGLLVAAHGLREASVAPDGTIAITLLRCFGWLSRDDFPSRAGGAGPTLPTPGGQSPGARRFRLAIVPFHDLAAAVEAADAFATAVHGATTRLHSGSLPLSASLAECEPREFRTTSIAQSERDGAIVVRGVSSGGRDGEVRVRAIFPVASAERVRLDETSIAPLAPDADGWVRTTARPNEIVTLRLRGRGP